MKLSFHGGARSVTGANYLLEIAGQKILIDCGLFQGSKYAEELNYAPFAYDPATIDYLFITHSHTDHIGRFPKLVKEGFRGRVFTTYPTKDLMTIAFPDNWSHIAEEAKADQHPPLYQPEDIELAMKLTEGIHYHQPLKLAKDLTATLYQAGHILGSVIVGFELNSPRQKIYFTGDLGNSPSLLLPDKEFVEEADWVVIESAYGDQVHEDKNRRTEIFKEILSQVVKNKGVLLIPSFAIERAQEILFEINRLMQSGEVPEAPVFLDSPLAIKMTEVYARHQHDLNQEAQSFVSEGKNIFDFPSLKTTARVEESKAINDQPGPKIIVAGSGMSNGGRILHHERRYLSDPHSAIVFIGYQVEGSLGRRILDQTSEVEIFGEKIPVRCLVKGIGAYSAHADQPALTEWTKKANKEKSLKKVFVVQGEESSAGALARKIKEEVNVEAIVPGLGEEYEL